MPTPSPRRGPQSRSSILRPCSRGPSQSLFPGGVGKTHSPEDFASLIGDVETKLFDRFDDDTWFYPGHGNDSTIGTERSSIPEWRERGW